MSYRHASSLCHYIITFCKTKRFGGGLRPIAENGLLSGERHHRHIKKRRPIYVVVWEIVDKKERQIEVIYVGTHERAPYQKH